MISLLTKSKDSTVVMTVVNLGKELPTIRFSCRLTVDYEEKFYAAGKIYR
jgi:polyribonucleotide nucleotidyltransferase